MLSIRKIRSLLRKHNMLAMLFAAIRSVHFMILTIVVTTMAGAVVTKGVATMVRVAAVEVAKEDATMDAVAEVTEGQVIIVRPSIWKPLTEGPDSSIGSL